MRGPITPRQLRLPLLVAAAAFAGGSLAASGQFTFVIGEVALTKANGQRVAAVRGLAVDPGDQIATGANGMAQLTMVDEARLSLRPNSVFRIEQYAQRPDGEEGAVLALARGTLRTFTGLLALTRRDRFVMRTKVASVGIRGSGNILHACAEQCDPSLRDASVPPGTEITVNHTIEGSHAITNFVEGVAPGMPPQQGGPQTIVTGPGQTAVVQGNRPPRNIPTPAFIAETASNPTDAAKGVMGGEGTGAVTRNFAPGDYLSLPPNERAAQILVGNNGLGFVTLDASSTPASDVSDLHDVVIANGGVLSGQAARSDLHFGSGDRSQLRGYSSYRGSLVSLEPTITGGTLAETHSVGTIVMGRWQGPGLDFSGPAVGNIHWIYAPSGSPPYLSEVLTGTATYALAAATSPTNQNNTAGSLGSATLNVNFSTRTLGFAINVTIPSAGANAGGAWTASAGNVPFALNSFFATTAGRLVITNGTGQSSTSNAALSGSVEGSFVGPGLQGVIVGYGFTDRTSQNRANHNTVSGVAGFTGVSQNAAAQYREGRVSDPGGFLAGSDFIRTHATTNRPDEVTGDPTGAVSAFAAPFGSLGGHARYTLGSAQVVQAGADPETGMAWGRWSGGTATVTGAGGSPQSLSLSSQSLHYIFAGTQQGPVALPLTGSATYDVIGSTSPTDGAGHVGTLGSAALGVDFTNRTASASVNVNIAGQTWTGNAPSMPIYRDQYFSAYTGNSIPGVPNLSSLSISCTPGCGAGARGSFDGFFTGRTGQRAGMMYNLGGVQGAVGFGRRGG